MVGETADGREAIELCRRWRPELLLTDVRMPRMDGLEVAREIKQEFPHIVVMMLTALEDPDYLWEALEAGAAGYILKYATAQQIIEAIRQVLGGEYWLDQKVTTKLVVGLAGLPGSSAVDLVPGRLSKELSALDPIEPLTPREADVLRLIVQGQSNKEIAQNLFVSVGNIKKYVQRLFAKVKVSDRTQLAIKAVKLGLLPEEEEDQE